MVELRISARPENLVLARLALAGVGASVAAPQDLLAEFKLAVTEACTNAIQHAYPAARGREEIVVRYTARPGRLEVEVEDFGIGLPTAPGDPDSYGDGRSGGLGLLIISELADVLTVTRLDSGTRVAFGRDFSSAG
jgi:serine/threonine-protein kinase RsbW